MLNRIAVMCVLVLALLISPRCTPEKTAVCTAGTQEACTCANGTSGNRTCNADGSAWGACSSCQGTPDGGNPPGDRPSATDSSPTDTGAPQDRPTARPEPRPAECAPGELRLCFSGPDTAKDKGICKQGKQRCQDNSQWGSCDGEVLPGKEVCNQKDDDCNGQVDDGGACGQIYSDVNCINHPQPTASSSTPGCDGGGACSCLVTSTGKVYVCASDRLGLAEWMPIETVSKECNSAAHVSGKKIYFCGGQELLCANCSGKIGWSSKQKGCAGGIMSYQKN